MSASIFLSKRYSLTLCYLILIIEEMDDQALNLESIHALWLKSRPSRSTFATLIKDMNDLGWIDKREGTKRSAFELRIDAKAIRDALQMRPALNFKRTWLFAESVFDFDKIEIYRGRGAAQDLSRSRRWTLQEELNSLLYPEQPSLRPSSGRFQP